MYISEPDIMSVTQDEQEKWMDYTCFSFGEECNIILVKNSLEAVRMGHTIGGHNQCQKDVIDCTEIGKGLLGLVQSVTGIVIFFTHWVENNFQTDEIHYNLIRLRGLLFSIKLLIVLGTTGVMFHEIFLISLLSDVSFYI